MLLDGLQSIEILTVTIRQGLIGQRPPPLCRLQLWRIGRQKVQGHTYGDLHVWTRMPACPIEPQQDLLVVPGPDGLRKLRQRHRERGERAGGQQPPHRTAGRGLHTRIAVAPLLAMLDHGTRSLPPAAPHAS